MTPEEVDKLMTKRKFTLFSKTGGGIYNYGYADTTRKPYIGCQIIPERNEFKFIYGKAHSLNKLETPWCSPITNEEHFKNILKGLRRWARAIEHLYEEDN